MFAGDGAFRLGTDCSIRSIITISPASHLFLTSVVRYDHRRSTSRLLKTVGQHGDHCIKEAERYEIDASRFISRSNGFHCSFLVEIIIKEDGRFLNLTGVPHLLKLRSGLSKYLYRRDCYEVFIDDIIASLPLKICKTFAILGTAGIGKSSLFFVLLKMLIQDPSQFGLSTRSFYFQTRDEVIWLYRHVHGTEFSPHFVDRGEELDEAVPLFADMETEHGSPKEHAGISFIFTSFRPSRFKELTKKGWRKVMPTWSADEQADYFNSTQFESEYSKEVGLRAYNNIQFFGGCIRSNIDSAITAKDPMRKIEQALRVKGDLVCERFFKAGFGGSEDVVSDVLIHRNPEMVDDKYDFDSESCTFSFASPYVLQRLLQLKDNMLVTEARTKYTAGTFRGGDDGNEFELLCLHGFQISGVKFLAQPLTGGAHATDVIFPAKQVLALNWRERENYLQVDVLYIPPYGNLESGDSFCLIKINERWTLVIIQCTIAETHPVKQNGVKVIHDCYKKNTALKIDDTVIMFMIPVNGKLKTKQALVTQKKKEEGMQEVQRITIAVTAQYKIENALVTVDVI